MQPTAAGSFWRSGCIEISMDIDVYTGLKYRPDFEHQGMAQSTR